LKDYELVKKGGQYKEGGNYTADGGYIDGDGANVSGFEIFNKNTTQVVRVVRKRTPFVIVVRDFLFSFISTYVTTTRYEQTCGSASLASYGTVIDGFTDFHGEDQAAIPPFAALIVQPKVDETIFSWRAVRQAVRSTIPQPGPPARSRLLKECCPLLFLFSNC